MLKLIPSVKKLVINKGFLPNKQILFDENKIDERVANVLKKLDVSAEGTKVTVTVNGLQGEGYSLLIDEKGINIVAQSVKGAFYAAQTLRQIFMHEQVPFVFIEDEPHFAYRGFYHDVTRGKVPTVKTLKKLIDDMAFFKLNALQLYVEHTYDFKELSDQIKAGGTLTAEELQELNAYCKQNFVDFAPSLSTFGHLFELLNQDKYKDIRCVDDVTAPYRWWGRMRHHTLDPLKDESIKLVKSLIDQYSPNFDSEFFNICCDETWDLTARYKDTEHDVAKLYVDFVKKIISHVKTKNKTVMMWADILLKHPEVIGELPEDTVFLNWNYDANPPEENVAKFAELNRKQIVCPGTTTWNRFCENIEIEEQNISRMAEYGYKYGALGVLNTNWGDWGNIASIDNSMYGLILGAAKAWDPLMQINDDFYSAVNFVWYQNENAIQILKKISRLNGCIKWMRTCRNYVKIKYNIKDELDQTIYESTLAQIQSEYKQIEADLTDKEWKNDEIRVEMLLAAQGACVCAEQYEKIMGNNPERLVDAQAWLTLYSQKWLEKNKPSELYKIQDVFTVLEK